MIILKNNNLLTLYDDDPMTSCNRFEIQHVDIAEFLYVFIYHKNARDPAKLDFDIEYDHTN